MDKDNYASFSELCSNESEGDDYCVVVRERESSSTIIIAPHGGGIEPATSEIALAIANNDLSSALFEGTKTKGNRILHIASTNFDYPKILNLVRKMPNVIAIHGEKSNNKIVYLGGADIRLGKFIRSSLEANGFSVEEHHKPELQGKSDKNICNRGKNGMGVQLEISSGLRKTFFNSLSAKGRGKPTDSLNVFSFAVREGLRSAGIL